MDEELHSIINYFRSYLHGGIGDIGSIKEEVLIKKADVEKLGREVYTEVNDFLHEAHTLTYPEFKVEQEKFDKLVEKNKDNLNLYTIYYIIKKIKLCDEFNGDLYFKVEAFKDIVKVLSTGYSYLQD